MLINRMVCNSLCSVTGNLAYFNLLIFFLSTGVICVYKECRGIILITIFASRTEENQLLSNTTKDKISCQNLL